MGLSSIFTGLANSPVEIALGLTLTGVFAAIYHPVGLAMVVQGRSELGMPLAVNGIFGNMGVASAALMTGLLIDNVGWRSAFYIPGAVSVLLGVAYFVFERRTADGRSCAVIPDTRRACTDRVRGNKLVRVFTIILFTTALGGVIFQSTTFALPKVLDERLAEFAGSATQVGAYTFLVFSIAAFAQLVVGYLLDNHRIRLIYIWVAFLQVLLFGIMMQLTGLWALITAIAFMLAVFGSIPINDVLVGRMAKSRWRSRAFAITYLVSFSTSAVAVPLIAWVYGNWGFERLFGVLAVLAFFILITVLFLPRENRPTSAGLEHPG